MVPSLSVPYAQDGIKAMSYNITKITLSLKVALLCGPPGLGKTTLSHVIARHAGYNVVEMNAR